MPNTTEGDERRGVDPDAHGSALDPRPGLLPVPPEIVQGDPEERNPLRRRKVGHLPNRDTRVARGTAQGELEVQVPREGLLHAHAADALPEGRPRELGARETQLLREFVEVLDFLVLDADLEGLHMAT